MKISNFIKIISKWSLIFLGILFSVLLVSGIIFWYKPRSITVAGIPHGYHEKKVSLNGITMNYVEGPVNGPPLLLIPGQIESWQGYKLIMSDLAKDHHVFIVDVRGQGKSSHTPGSYSYNICGKDLQAFLKNVIKSPAIVSGLSSGAVLAIWLGAYTPEYVKAIIAEDPPLFSSIHPQIKKEKFMTYGFYNIITHFEDSKSRDFVGYFSAMGMPIENSESLKYLPAWLAKLVHGIYEFNKNHRPDRVEDPPYLPLQVRLLYKYLETYDIDFARATVDGRLSRGFDPDDALKKLNRPLLLMHASWSRYKYWGLIGAMDDDDARHIQAKVKTVTYKKVKSSHDIHVSNPEWWLDTFQEFEKSL